MGAMDAGSAHLHGHEPPEQPQMVVLTLRENKENDLCSRWMGILVFSTSKPHVRAELLAQKHHAAAGTHPVLFRYALLERLLELLWIAQVEWSAGKRDCALYLNTDRKTRRQRRCLSEM